MKVANAICKVTQPGFLPLDPKAAADKEINDKKEKDAEELKNSQADAKKALNDQSKKLDEMTKKAVAAEDKAKLNAEEAKLEKEKVVAQAAREKKLQK